MTRHYPTRRSGGPGAAMDTLSARMFYGASPADESPADAIQRWGEELSAAQKRKAEELASIRRKWRGFGLHVGIVVAITAACAGLTWAAFSLAPANPGTPQQMLMVLADLVWLFGGGCWVFALSDKDLLRPDTGFERDEIARAERTVAELCDRIINAEDAASRGQRR